MRPLVCLKRFLALLLVFVLVVTDGGISNLLLQAEEIHYSDQEELEDTYSTEEIIDTEEVILEDSDHAEYADNADDTEESASNTEWSNDDVDGTEESVDVIPVDTPEEVLDSITYEVEEPAKFEATTLVLKARDPSIDFSTANTVIQYDDLFILSYDSEELCHESFEYFRESPSVEWVEIDSSISTESVETSKEYSKELIGSFERSSKRVAVLDSGISEEWLQSGCVIDSSLNLVYQNSTSVIDDNGHGTDVFNVITESYGKIPRVLPIKLTDSEGNTSSLLVYLGIKKALEIGVDAINISLAGYKVNNSELLRSVIDESTSHGVPVIVSSGNYGEPTDNYYPACIDSAMVVGAVDDNCCRESYSNYGNSIDFVSYGRSNHSESVGTSVATASVTGKVLLELESISPDGVYESLKSKAIDLGDSGFDVYYGHGFIGDKRDESDSNESNGESESSRLDDADLKLLSVDWRSLSDTEFSNLIASSYNVVVHRFLVDLSKEDFEEVLSRDTILKQTTQTFTLDENGNEIPGKEWIYYQFLLSDEFKDTSIQGFAKTGTAKVAIGLKRGSTKMAAGSIEFKFKSDGTTSIGTKTGSDYVKFDKCSAGGKVDGKDIQATLKDVKFVKGALYHLPTTGTWWTGSDGHGGGWATRDSFSTDENELGKKNTTKAFHTAGTVFSNIIIGTDDIGKSISYYVTFKKYVTENGKENSCHSCSVCSETISNHSYGTPTYTWPSNSTCKGSVDCKNCSYTKTEKVDTTCTTTKSTCTTKGKKVYKANFASPFTDQSKTVTLDLASHSYGTPTYTWSSDNSTCTAKANCKNCTKIKTEKVDTTNTTTASTCTEPGTVTYTATFKDSSFAKQTKVITGTVAGHSYGSTYLKQDTPGRHYRKCTRCNYELSQDCSGSERVACKLLESTGTYGFVRNNDTFVYTSNNKGVNSSVAKSKLLVCIPPICTGTVKIAYGVSSEYADRFSIVCTDTDGDNATTLVNGASGDKTGFFELSAGEYVLELSYSKDSSIHSGNDKAWISVGHVQCGVCGQALKDGNLSGFPGFYPFFVLYYPEGSAITKLLSTADKTASKQSEDDRWVYVYTTGKGTYGSSPFVFTAADTVENPLSSFENHFSSWDSGDSTFNYNWNVYKKYSVDKLYNAIFTPKFTVCPRGHEVYTWSDDYSECTVSLSCNTDSSHNVVKTVATTENVTKEPTCTTSGSVTYTANFGTVVVEGHSFSFGTQTKTLEISPTGHNWSKQSNRVKVAATCTTKGSNYYDCSVCDSTSNTSVTYETPALGHSYDSDFTIDKAATCTIAGSKSKHCKRSGCTSTTDVTEIPATGHSWDAGTVTTAASCTSDGVKTFTCKTCGSKRTEAISSLGHTGDDDGSVIKAATCTTDGSRYKKCSRCGADYSSKVISALGHSYSSDFTIDKPATCTTAGSKSKHCKRSGCTSTTSVTEISATGHSYGDWTTVTAATCTATGSKKRTCSVCGNVETATIPATGHNWSKQSNRVKVAATCTTKGSNYYDCSVCDSTSNTSVTYETPALGHTGNSAWYHKDGYCYKTCTRSNCGAKYDPVAYTLNYGGTSSCHQKCSNCNTTMSAEHTMVPGAWTTGKTKSTRTFTCACGYSYVQECSHSEGFNSVVKKAATCTEKGTTTYTCPTCGYSYDAVDIAIDPSNHTGTLVTGGSLKSAVTCTTAAVYWKKYSCCGVDSAQYYSSGSPLGHDWDTVEYTWNSSKSSCTAKRICKRNSSHVEQETVNSTDSVVLEPKCTTNGTRKHSVAFSNNAFLAQTTNTAIPALDHSYSSTFTVDEAATCTAAGSKSKHCTRSGCTSTTSVTVIPALGHSSEVNYRYSTVNGVSNGMRHKQCERCAFVLLREYLLTVEKDNGIASINNSNYYQKGSSVSIVATMKNGYSFKGWEGASGDSLTTSIVMPENPKTVKATTNLLTYNISYDLKGGSVSGNPVSYNAETKTFTLKNPTKRGYTFVGWSGTGIEDTLNTVSVYTGSYGDRIYRAVWSRDDYQIKYVLSGGTNNLSNPASYSVEDGDTRVFAPSRVGYDFVGWNDGVKSGVTGYVIPASSVGNLTLTAEWKARSDTAYKVQHWKQRVGCNPDFKNAANYELVSSDTDSLVGVSDSSVAPATKSYKGFISPNKETITIAADGTTVLNYYYVRKKQTLSVLSGKGAESVTESISVEYGTPVSRVGAASIGYSWNGWEATGIEGTSSKTITFDMPDNSVTIKATARLEKYSISYNLAGGSMSGNPTEYSIESSTFTLKNPSRVGYDFVGWSGTDVVGTSTSVCVEKGSVGDRAFTAVWTPKVDTQYRIEYWIEDLDSDNYTLKNTSELTGISDSLHSVDEFIESIRGFTFDKASVNGIEVDDFRVTADGSLVVKLYYTRNSYRVTFDSVGGSSVNSIRREFEGVINPLPVTQRRGYSFRGWFYDSDDSEFTATSKVVKNVSVYAKWQLDVYSISYDLGGGLVTWNPVEYSINTETFTLTNPNRIGYDFVGWIGTGVEEPSLSVSVEKGSVGNREYRAVWRARTDTKYRVEHYLQGIRSDKYTLQESESFTGETDLILTLSDSSKNFTGFTYDKACVDGSVVSKHRINPDGSLVIELYYTRNSYSLDYQCNGGDPLISDSFQFEEKIEGLKNPIRKGYTFVEWHGDSDLQKSVLEFMPANSVSVYAEWSLNTYSISYDLAGGSVEGNPTEYTVESDTFTLKNPSRVGYDFVGWTGTDVEKPSLSVSVEKGSIGDRSFTAVWEARTDIKITVNHFIEELGKDTFVLKSTNSTTGTADEEVKTEDYFIDIPGFSSLNSIVDDSVVTKTIVKPDGSLVINEYYSRNSYELKFDSCGGSSIESIVREYEEPLGELLESTRVGYTFLGWYTQKENGLRITEDTVMGYKNTTCYAHWEPIVYNLSYDLAGGSVEGNPTEYTIESNTFTLKNPSRVGYDFVGWAGTDTEEPSRSVSIEKGSIGNRVFNAVWNPREDTKFVIEHYREDLNSDDYTLVDSEDFEGVTDSIHDISDFVNDTYGFTFDKAIAGSEEVEEFRVIPDGSLVVELYYSRNSYELKFDSCGGSSIESIIREYEEPLGELSEPIRKGYTFLGWYTKEEDGLRITESTVMGHKNTTCYAHWSLNTYSLSYDLAGGSVEGNPTEYSVESDTFTLKNPSRVGYDFVGWTGTNTEEPSQSVSVEKGSIGDRSFTAVWNPREDTKFVIEHYREDLNSDDYTLVDSEDFEGVTDSIHDISDFINDTNGFTFGKAIVGSEEVTEFKVIPDGSLVVELYYSRDSYELQFDSCGGSSIESIVREYEEALGELLEPTRKGYTFLGWYTQEEDGLEIVEDTVMGYENTTCYAHWSLNTYSISYDLAGGSVEGNPTEYTVESDTFTLENPSRVGYDFVGWTGTDTEEPSQNVSVEKGNIGNRSFTAVWEARTDIKITVNHFIEELGKDTFVLKSTNSTTGTADEEVQTEDYFVDIPGFSSLNSEVDDNIVTETVVKPDGSLVINEYYSRDSYELKFDSCGGSSIESIVREFEEPLGELSEPTRKGYTFLGWYTREEDGLRITEDTVMGYKNTTCYAHWSLNTYSLSYDLAGGSVEGNPTEYSVESDTFTLKNPSRVGYDFVGWVGTDTEEPSQSVSVEKGSIGDRSFAAVWEARTDIKITVNHFIQELGKDTFVLKSTNSTTGTADEEVQTEDYFVDIPGFSSLNSEVDGCVVAETVVKPDGSLVINEYYSRNSYELKFDSCGGSSIESIVREFEEPLGELLETIRKGYTFLGWYTQKEDGLRITEDTVMGYENTTCYAHWSLNTYSISYDLAGGSVEGNPAEYTVESDTFTLKNPSRVGYDFVGWIGTDTEEPSQSVSVEKGSIGDRSFTAVWNPREDTKFVIEHYREDLNSDNYTLVDSEDFEGVSDSIHSINDFVNDTYGFTFDKAIVDSKEVTEFKVIPDGSLVVELYYSRDSYELKFDSCGGSSIESIVREFEEPLGELLESTRKGYTFLGWYTQEEDGLKIVEDTVMGYKNTTCYAHWSLNTYSISYDLAGGSVEGNPTEYTVESDTFTLKNPSRVGYDFVGWTGTDTEEPSQSVSVEKGSIGNRSFTAVWNPREDTKFVIKHYREDLNSDDYTLVDSEDFEGVTDSIHSISDFVNDTYGFTFAKAIAGSEEITKFNVIPDGSLVVELYYSRDSYELKFDSCGGSGIESIVREFEEPFGELLEPIRKGYTFSGWYTQKEDGLEITESTLMGYKNTTCYAHWIPIVYKLSYDLAGGSLEGNPTEYTVESDTFTLKNPSRVGYDFVGWVGTDTEEPSQSVSIEKGSIGDRSFTAVWKARTDTKFTVNHYQQKLNSSGTDLLNDYTLKESIVYRGETDSKFTAKTLEYEGFTAPKSEECFIIPDGSGALNYYYKRNSYKLSVTKDKGISNVSCLTADNSLIITDKGSIFDSFFGNNSILVEYGSTVNITYDLKNGYSFKSCTTDSSVTEKGTSCLVKMPARDLEVDLLSSVTEYCLEYDLDGGSVSSELPKTCTVEETFTLPRPKKDNYTFVGWSTNKDLQPDLNKEVGGSGADNLVLFANWSKDEFIISYDLNGGVLFNPNPTSYNVDSNDIKLLNPTRKGYDFVGWSYDGSVSDDVIIKKGSSGNKHFTAIWKEATIDYKVNYYVQNLNDTEYTLYDSVVLAAENGSIVEPKPIVIRGFDTPSSIKRYVTPEGTEVNYYYTRKQYKVIVVGSDGIDDVSIANGSAQFGTELELNATIKKGYQFNHWLVNDKEIPDLKSSLVVTGDTIISPVVTKTTFSVEYNLAEGHCTDLKTSYELGESFALPKPLRTGYDFIGWVGSCGSIPQRSVTVPSDSACDLKYTAVWDARSDVVYTTRYWVQKIGKPSEFNKTNYQLFESVERFAVADSKITPVLVSLEGFTANKTEPVVIKADGTTVVDCVYTRNHYSLKVSCDAGVATPFVGSKEVEYGDSVSIPISLAKGYTWKGWSSDCNSVSSTIARTIKFSMPSSDVSLKANSSLDEYTIYYNFGEVTSKGNLIKGDSSWNFAGKDYKTKYTVESEFSIPDPVIDGYAFVGWKLSNGKTVQSYKVEKGSIGNLMLQASWKRGSLLVGNTYWFITEEGVLTIVGNDDIRDLPTPLPWENQKDKITGLDLSKYTGKLYSIEEWFKGCINIVRFPVLPDGIENADKAFEGCEKLEGPIKLPFNEDCSLVNTFKDTPKNIIFVSDIGGIGGVIGDRPVYRTSDVFELTNNETGLVTEFTYKSDDIVVENPKKVGYDFTGWELNNGDVVEPDFIVKQGTVGDIVINPIWDLVNYNVTVEKTADDVETFSYTIEDDDIEIENPVSEDAVFVGWFINGDYSDAVSSYCIPKGSYGDLELEAAWVEDYSGFDSSGSVSDGGIDKPVPDDPVIDEPVVTEKPFLCVPKYKKYASDKSFKIEYHNAVGKVKFSSTNKKVASVNSKGIVSLKGPGKADIILSANNGKVRSVICVKPAVVKGVKLKSSKNKKLIASWKKDTKVDGYQIQYDTSKYFLKPKKITIPRVKGTSKTLSNLKANQKYYVRVRSYKVVDDKKYWSKWSSVAASKVK